MSRPTKAIRTLTLSLLLASTALSGAHAQIANEAAERLKALMQEQGTTLTWDSVDIDGENAVLAGVQIEAGGQTESLGDLTLNGISQTDDGFHIEEVLFDTLMLGDDDAQVEIEGVELSGVLLPNEDKQDQYGGTAFYETASVGRAVFTQDGTEIASMEGLVTEMTAPVDGEAMEYSGSVETFSVDLSIVEDPQQAAIIKALGYEQLSGSLAFAGDWQPTDGRFTLSQFDFAIDEAGTLGVTLEVGGYTPQFLASLRELQAQMAANPDADNSSQGLAMLGLMQQLTFHGAEVSFNDDSLTNKVLEFVANSQGAKPADIANQAKAVVPFALGQLGNPDLTMQATQAISAYLDNPQSLRVSALPASPVPFAMLAAAAMAAPAELTKTLGVTVTAND